MTRRLFTWTAVAVLAMLIGASDAPGGDTCAGTEVQAVVISTDGSPRPATCGELQSKEPPPDMHHAWWWSPTDAPRGIAPGEWPEWNRDSGSTGTLLLHLNGIPEDTTEVTVIAGSQQMWQSVPEQLMPRWTVSPGDAVSIPRASETPWRLRVVSEVVASGWVDVPPMRQTVVVRARPSAALEIQTSGFDGTPVGDIIGRVFSAGGASIRGAVQPVAMIVGDAGKLMVEPVPTDEAFRLVLRSRGFAPRIVEGRPSDLPTELDLLPGARLIGRVVDGDSGEAIEGVVISVDYWIDPSLPWPMSRIKRSDSTGSWEVGALPPGETFVVVRHPGFGRFWRRVVVEEGQRLDLGTAILHRGADLKAEVVDDLGRPVPGATVRVDNGPGATVDEEGLVSLTGIPLSGAELAVSAESHLPQTMPIRAPFPETLRIRLTRAYHVMARFVDADGLPVTAGTAAIETGTSTTFQGLDGQGRLAADLPPDVEYSLVLEGPTTPAVRLRIPAGGPGNQWDLGTIEAPRGYVAEGTVLSAETGEPLSAARVWTLRPSAQGPVVAWMQKKFIETTTAGDGRFVLGGLPSGQIALRVESPGYARVHVEVGFDEGEDALVDVGLIRIPRGSELRVEVSSAETKGMTARLDLRGEGLPADFLHATVRGAEAVFPRVAPGTYDLVVQRGPKEICAQSISIGDAPESVECEGADVRVEGIVVVGDRTSGRGTLVWRSREQSDRSFPEGIMNVTTSSGLRRQSTFTTRRTDVVVPVDRDGWFETLGVSSGAWKVAWYPDSGGAGASVDVDVPQVETFEVTLRYPSIEISGLVVDEDGKPLPDARVRDLLSGNLALSGAGGEFRLTGLSPGPVELQARLRMLESEVLSLTVEADRSVEPPTLVVRETSDRVLRVEVVAENGQPAPSAFVFFHTGSGADQIATTDIYGAVAFRLPDPPPQQFRVAAFTGGAWILGNQLNAGDLDGVVKLAPKPSGTIIVVSEMAAGSPAIVSAAGWNLSWLLTRVGMRPMVGTDSELRLRGIPEGAYTVTLRDATATVSVRRDRESIVELDGS